MQKLSFRKLAFASLPILALATGVASANQWESTSTKAFSLKDAVQVGSVDESASIHVVIGLSLRNKAELDEMVRRMGTPGDLMFGQHFTHEYVESHYGPAQADVAGVIEHLRNSGFTNIEAVGQLVEADGSVRAAKLAFNTDFAMFNHDGETVYGNTKPAMIPGSLKGIVESVMGLDNATRFHTMISHADATVDASSGFDPASFPKAYGAVSSTSTGSSTVIGIITSGSMTTVQSDLKDFESANSITPATVKVEGKGKFGNSGLDEWDLDSQDIIAMSGGVKTLILYASTALSDAGLTTDYNLVVSDDTAKAINVSLGGCETTEKTSGGMATDDAVFEKAAAQGQTFFVATGDSNYAECGSGKTGQSYPAVSPYVTAAGGTSLTVTSSGTYSGETVWDTSKTEGTGGGPSVDEPKPSWQDGVANITSNSRGVPDVSMDADPETGAIIYVRGKTEQVGGTSLATPLSTGVWARAESASGNTLGFAAPLIYTLAEGSKYSTTFHDVTSGNNNGETAAKGWDYCTGWGSFNIDAFVTAIK